MTSIAPLLTGVGAVASGGLALLAGFAQKKSAGATAVKEIAEASASVVALARADAKAEREARITERQYVRVLIAAMRAGGLAIPDRPSEGDGP